jgi:putative oxidoreductase
MTIVRRLARPLLAAPLIQSGLDAARHPGPQAEIARPLLDRVTTPLKLPQDPVLVVRGAGAVTTAAGFLLATGRLPRLSALAIVVSAPVIQNNQPFWKEKDAELRRSQRTAFLRNLGLLGGALLATVDTEGRPSLAWRSRRAAHLAADATRDAGASTAGAFADAQESARQSGRQARKAAAKARKQAGRRAVKAQAKVQKKAAKAQAKVQKKAGRVRESLPV